MSNSNPSGDIVGRDKHVYGDEVQGDKVAGDKILGDKIVIYQERSTQPSAVIETSVPPPPEPTRPPDASNFVGRTEELAYFAQRLEEHKLAVIAGMAGVGKTALAATLTRWVAEPDQLFWHTFQEGEGIETVIRRLAGFLAWHGHDDLWQLLEIARITGGKPPTTAEQFSYLLQLMRRGRYLLCFDDFHEVEHDPQFTQLIDKLRDALTLSDFSILVTSRRVPEFVHAGTVMPLEGLTKADAERLIRTVNIPLSAAQVDILYENTAGNAQFLTLAIDALDQGKDPSDLIDRLAATDDVERYLLQEVDDVLSGEERAVMGAVAILLGYGGAREAIEAILEGRNVFRILRRLTDRHLLTVQQQSDTRIYQQHAIVRAFYYEFISPQQRRRLHHQAGDYYARAESDLLRSGIHYECAGDFSLAVKQATADVWKIINEGEAQPLQRLLQRLLQQLQPITSDGQRAEEEVVQTIKVRLSCAQVDSFIGQRKAAAMLFEQILSDLSSYPITSDMRPLKAQVHLGLAELYELEDPQQMLDWARRGLDELEDEQGIARGALLLKLGEAQMLLGNLSEAEDALVQGLKNLPTGPSRLRATALKHLSGVALYQDQIKQSKDYAVQALAVAEELHDRYQMSELLVASAIATYEDGDWPQAITEFEHALEIAQSVGSESLQAMVEMNLGGAYINTEQDQKALQYLQHSLELADRLHLQVVALSIYCRLADFHSRLGQWDEVQINVDIVKEMAQAQMYDSAFVFCYRIQAQIELARGRHQAAFNEVQQAIALASTLEEEYEQGLNYRVLGEIFTDTRQVQQAKEAFQNSLNILNAQNTYEAARCKVQFGLALFVDAQPGAALNMLHDARSVFQALAARRDLAHVDELLSMYLQSLS